jgi:hypothetical protein
MEVSLAKKRMVAFHKILIGKTSDQQVGDETNEGKPKIGYPKNLKVRER